MTVVYRELRDFLNQLRNLHPNCKQIGIEHVRLKDIKCEGHKLQNLPISLSMGFPTGRHMVDSCSKSGIVM